MKVKTKFFLFVFLVGEIFFSQKFLALAQNDAQGFSISPFFQEINVQKNQSAAPFSIEVKNNTELVRIFRASVLDFGALDESGGVAFLGSSDNLKYGLASWISLQNDSLVINPGETQVLRGNIENKESLSPGGHYGAIYFNIESDEKIADEKKNVAVDPSFAALLFVRKIGGEIYELNMKNNDFSRNIFKLPRSVELRFQNSGNVHVTPRGTIEITDPLGRKVRKGIINEQSALMLPETFRLFSSKITKLGMAFIPGRYTLVISYRYDGKDEFARSSNSFIFIPPIFILSIVTLVALGTGVYFRRKIKKQILQ